MPDPPPLSVGDVFVIPLDAKRWGAGQVVGRYGEDAYYFAFFARTHAGSELPDPIAAVDDDIALLGLSFDARFTDGTWEVIGNTGVADEVPLPAYREAVGGPDRVDVVDYSGTVRRRASPEEAAILGNRKFVAPIRLERAMSAKAGIRPWLDSYAELEPGSSMTSRAVFGNRRMQ